MLLLRFFLFGFDEGKELDEFFFFDVKEMEESQVF